nr:ATP-binding cassette domain-containing protein [Rhodococcus sp. UFZ-B548]
MIAGHKRFQGRRNPVLNGLDLDIDRGEFLAVLGVSGSGKSTLLRILAGLESLDSGSVQWDQSAGECQPHTGVVFQQPLLMPWLNVADNIAFGGAFGKNKQRFDRSYGESILRTFGLGDLADAYPDQLSGGQAQRVAVIRATATRPQLLLLDEPFSALDPVIRSDLQQWLKQVTAALGTTVVLVTHDVDEAILLGSRIALLGTSGTIRQEWDAADDAKHMRSEILGQYRDLPQEAV